MRLVPIALVAPLALVACGPQEPGPPPGTFAEASLVPALRPQLSSCQAACRKLQTFACAGTSIPDGDCAEACRSVEQVRRIGADPGCIVGARSCAEVEACQRAR
jgi:hypothetical protein